MESDLIDELITSWNRERPELNVDAMAVVGRILILGKKLETRVNDVLKPYGLNYTDLDVLATLRRQGRPYQLSPSDLMHSVLITSGAMTACLNRLESDGLIVREVSKSDRRGRVIFLTKTGQKIIDKIISLRFADATDTVSGLDTFEQKNLSDLLRQLSAKL